LVHSASVSSPSHASASPSFRVFRLSKKCSKLADSGHMFSLINFFLPFTPLPQCVCFFLLWFSSFHGPLLRNQSSTSCNSALPCSIWSDQRATRFSTLFYVKVVLNFPTQSTDIRFIRGTFAHLLLFCLSCAHSDNYFPSQIHFLKGLCFAPQGPSSLSIYFTAVGIFTPPRLMHESTSLTVGHAFYLYS